MKVKLIIRILACFFIAAGLCFSASFRTSFNNLSLNSPKKQYIAVDFKVPIGDHITAPVGKGKSIAPSIELKNAKITNTFWPKSQELLNSDGTISEYQGYSKDFTIIYSVEIEDLAAPIEYDLFYVSCGNSCIPKQQKGIIPPNGLILEDEIAEVDGKSINQEVSLIIMMLFGILGGIILNFMPCVFPIVAMKLFSIIKSSKENPNIIRKHSVAFALGNTFSFGFIGAILLIFRSFVPDLGWGFYMQEPVFVVVLMLAFLLCGLHFWGMYSINIPLKRISLTIKQPYAISFFNGMFGAIASASCVGPFVGIAIVSALLYSNFLSSILIFISIGIGVSIPFLLISIFPSIIKLIPAPGKWLEIFKEFMGLIMLLSCVWLLWVLTSQINISNVMLIIAVMLIISFFIWTYGRSDKSNISRIILFAGFFIFSSYSIYLANISNEKSEHINWIEYSQNALDNAMKSGNPVFINFTASWCINCQFNNRVFSDKELIEIFKLHNIQAIKCDWTNRSNSIFELLKNYESAGVPLYIYYPSGRKNYIKLPTIITKDEIIKHILKSAVDK
jgi:thiol:disulfide interchange protein DsbD